MTHEIIFGKEYYLESERDTAIFAAKLSRIIYPGMTVGLIGELGAGKTTLVRYILNSLGSVELVSSPTFVLSNEYILSDNIVLEHWDLYRINALPEELIEACPKNKIRIIEWADKEFVNRSMFDLFCILSYDQNTEIVKRFIVVNLNKL